MQEPHVLAVWYCASVLGFDFGVVEEKAWCGIHVRQQSEGESFQHTTLQWVNLSVVAVSGWVHHTVNSWERNTTAGIAWLPSSLKTSSFLRLMKKPILVTSYVPIFPCLVAMCGYPLSMRKLWMYNLRQVVHPSEQAASRPALAAWWETMKYVTKN